MRNAEWFGKRLEERLVPQLLAVKGAVFERVLPAFANVDAEADARAKAVLEAFGAAAGPDDDPSDAYENARDEAVDHFMTMTNVRQMMINALAVSAFHLFQQQALLLLRRELWPFGHEHDLPEKRKGFLVAFREELLGRGVDIETLPAWTGVTEFKLIANTIKHADGDSAEKLRARRPDLFVPSAAADDPFRAGMPKSMTTPAFGDDLYVTEHELGGQIDNLCTFWRSLAGEVRARNCV